MYFYRFAVTKVAQNTDIDINYTQWQIQRGRAGSLYLRATDWRRHLLAC